MSDHNNKWDEEFNRAETFRAESEAQQERFLQAACKARPRFLRELSRMKDPLAPTAHRRFTPLTLGRAAALVLLLSSGIVLLQTLTRRAVAVEYEGIQIKVLNTADNRLLQGVEVRDVTPSEQAGSSSTRGLLKVINAATKRLLQGVEVRDVTDVDPGGSPVQQRGVLVAVSDAMGSFVLPSPPGQGRRLYQMSFQGKDIGQLVTGDDPQAVKGMHRVERSIPAEEVEQNFSLVLQPGKSVEPSPGLRVELDSSAAGNWTGTLTYEHNWPLEFLYGRVLDGIFVLRGPASDDIILSVRLDDERLHLMRGSSRDLRLIQHDAHYAELGEWEKAFHHGWFVTDNPRYGFAPTSSPQLISDRGAEWLQWRAQCSAPYAITLPPAGDGDFRGLISNVELASGAEPKESAVVGLCGSQQGQRYVYHYQYQTKGYATRWTFPPYDAVYGPSINIEGNCVPREFYNGEQLDGQSFRLEPTETALPEVLAQGERRKVPGDCYFYRNDFTMTDTVTYGPVSPDYSLPLGDFNIRIGPANLGKTVQCAITGPLHQLKRGGIRWDWDNDGVFDATGTSTELVLSAPGCYRISATLTGKNNAVKRLVREINIAGPEVLGFIADDQLIDTPVMEGLANPPAQEHGLLYAARTAVRSNAGLGWHAGAQTPLLLINPPPEYRSVPLKELKIVLYASPRTPEIPELGTRDGFLTPFVQQVTQWPTSPQGLLGCSDAISTNGVDSSLMQAGGFSYVAYRALQEHFEQPLSGASRYLNSRRQNLSFAPGLLQVTGVDLTAGLSESALVKKLRAFQNSPQFAMVQVHSEQQCCTFSIDLHGWKMPPESLGLVCGAQLETMNVLTGGQYEFYSGGEAASSVTLSTADGRVFRRYFDFSSLE